MQEFIFSSSQEFVDRLMEYVNIIDDNTLDSIFLEIENEINVEIPVEVKIVVKTVIFRNLEMINEIYNERNLIK